jgi:hypothetical protein
MSTDTLDLARKLFRAENPSPFKYPQPFGREPTLDDLWPVDQQKYIRMAEFVLKERAQP